MAVNDFSFFGAIDDLVRRAMVVFEVRLLPTFKQAVKDTKLDAKLLVEDVSIEGYYSNSPELTAVLKHFRVLQNNYSDIVTDSVKKLHSIYSNSIFGLGPAKVTAINKGEGILIPDGHPDRKSAVISPMFDALRLAVQSVSDKESPAHWNIQSIMNETESIDLGTNLVALAVLVDRFYKNKSSDKKYVPVASAMGAETTIGSGYRVPCLGVSFPHVSPEVEQKGIDVINAYNQLFASFPEGKGIRLPTDIEVLKVKAEDFVSVDVVGRCVCLGEDHTGAISNMYHWGIVFGTDFGRYESGLKVVDFKKPHVVTTQDFKNEVFSDPKKYVDRV